MTAVRSFAERLAECEEHIGRTRKAQIAYELNGMELAASVAADKLMVLLDIWSWLHTQTEKEA